MPNECAGLFGRLFGHDYQPRFTHGAPTYKVSDSNDVFSMVFSDDVASVITASKPRTYHGDVCRRCGDVKNQPK